MIEYTMEDLEDLLRHLELLGIPGFFSSNTAESAIRNTINLIRNYKKDGPDKIRSKIHEFAEVGKTANGGSSEIHPYQMVYLLLYETPVEELPMYLDTPFDVIAVWRLCWAKE
jgi:hypothetical protein